MQHKIRAEMTKLKFLILLPLLHQCSRMWAMKSGSALRLWNFLKAAELYYAHHNFV